MVTQSDLLPANNMVHLDSHPLAPLDTLTSLRMTVPLDPACSQPTSAEEKMCCDVLSDALPDTSEPMADDQERSPTVLASLPLSITCSRCSRDLPQARVTVSQLRKYRLQVRCTDCIRVPETDPRIPALYEFLPSPTVSLPPRQNLLEDKSDPDALLPADMPADSNNHDELVAGLLSPS
jgi:hypothetical protein